MVTYFLLLILMLKNCKILNEAKNVVIFEIFLCQDIIKIHG